MRGNQRAEDPLTYGYAKFLVDLNNNLGYLEQERYMALRPVFSAVYWLLSSAPDWRASAMQRRDMSQQAPVWPLHGGTPDTSINVVLQRERSIIKAMVLADAPAGMIAQQLNYAPEIINIFEQLSWDIRGKATARAWLHNFVFPEGIQASIDSSDFERLVLQRAYTHGLQGVLSFLHLTGHIADPKQYARDTAVTNTADLVHKTMTTIQSVTPGSRNAPEILAVAVAVDKTEREMDLKQKAQEPQGTDDEKAMGKQIMGRLAIIGQGFLPADPSVPCDLGAEERLDDTPFQDALAKILLEEVQLT